MPLVVKLWSGKSFKPETIPLIKSVNHVLVHKAEKGHYQFLLGADIIDHNGTLFCGWGNSRIDENDKWSVMGERRSEDGGLSWGDYKLLAPGAKGKEAHSHGVYFSHEGRLYAFVPRAEYNITGYSNLCAELFAFDDKTKEWNFDTLIFDGKQFWPMAQPQLMENGNYIMPGIICGDGNVIKAEPAVALSKGNDIRKWRIIKVPTPRCKNTWAEGGLIIKGARIQYIFRNAWSRSHKGQTAFSDDFGESWSKSVGTNIPMSPSKPCCGTLSTGQNYLVFNPAGNGRNTLAIAVSEPGEETFSKIWRIQHGESPQPLFKGFGKGCQWAYPLAHEYDGKLYVVYTSSKEDCCLSIIPLDSLK